MRWCWLLCFVHLTACVSDNSFGCSEDGQCNEGSCESNGYCSFPDDACPSGRRYGEYAGGGLAGVCVQEEAETSGASATSTGGHTASTATGGTTDTPTAGSTGVAECEGVCATEPVLPWSGPVVLTAAGSGACEPDAVLWTAGDGLTTQTPCDCACDASEASADCGYHGYVDSSCEGDPDDTLLAPTGQCVAVSLVVGVTSVAETGAPATCEGAPAPPPAFAQLFEVCEPNAAGTCEDGSACFNRREDAAMCIWRDGEHDCPSASDQRTVLHRDVAGAFDCGCSCGALDGACQTISLHPDEDCVERFLEIDVEPTPDCTPLMFMKPVSGVYAQVVPTGCEDTGSRNTPEPRPEDPAAMADPVTFCCF